MQHFYFTFWWQLCRFTPCSAHYVFPLNLPFFLSYCVFNILFRFVSKQTNDSKTRKKALTHSFIRSFTAPAKSSTLVACKFYYFILFSNTLFSPSRILAIVIIYSFVFVIISRWSTLELQRVRMRMCSGLLFPCIFRKNFVHFIYINHPTSFVRCVSHFFLYSIYYYYFIFIFFSVACLLWNQGQVE